MWRSRALAGAVAPDGGGRRPAARCSSTSTEGRSGITTTAGSESDSRASSSAASSKAPVGRDRCVEAGFHAEGQRRDPVGVEAGQRDRAVLGLGEAEPLQARGGQDEATLADRDRVERVGTLAVEILDALDEPAIGLAFQQNRPAHAQFGDRPFDGRSLLVTRQAEDGACSRGVRHAPHMAPGCR